MARSVVASFFRNQFPRCYGYHFSAWLFLRIFLSALNCILVVSFWINRALARWLSKCINLVLQSPNSNHPANYFPEQMKERIVFETWRKQWTSGTLFTQPFKTFASPKTSWKALLKFTQRILWVLSKFTKVD